MFVVVVVPIDERYDYQLCNRQHTWGILAGLLLHSIADYKYSSC